MDIRSIARGVPLLLTGLSLLTPGCGGSGTAPNPPTPAAMVPTPVATASPSPTPTAPVTNDATLWALLTTTDPFSAYRPFPGVAEIESGRLDGSEAHPRVRVTLNSIALGALQNGKLPAGARFPNRSVIFKEVLDQGIYAVMLKDEGGPISGSGWVWAEFRTGGAVAYPTSSRGGACIGCHSRQRGPENDLVRTFERQP